MNQEKYICLIQGRARELEHFGKFKTKRSALITLSWDYDLTSSFVNNHYFLPNSTWAEGRNFLLERAQELYPELEYVIFMDGDLNITQGDFNDFLNFLELHKPDLGLPLSNQIRESSRYIAKSVVQTQTAFDQIMQAYSRKIVDDGICIPYTTDLDAESWWYSCEINQYLSVKYIGNKILQYNKFQIANTMHTSASDISSGSRYVGGITKEGLKKCKTLVTKKYGQQKPLIGTLFHPPFLPKPTSIKFKTYLMESKKNSNLLKRTFKITTLTIGTLYSLVTRLIAGVSYPSSQSIPTILNPRVERYNQIR